MTRNRNMNIASVVAFLAIVFIAVPAAISASGRIDLYYTLTSVALLSIGSCTSIHGTASA